MDREKARSSETSEKAGESAAGVLVANQTTEPCSDSLETQPEPEDLLRKMIDAFFARRFEQAEAIYKNMTDAEPNAVARLRQKACYDAFRYMYASDPSALQSLRTLADNEDIRSKVFFWIGHCHEHADRPDDAIAAYEQAALSSDTDEERARLIASVGACLLRIGRADDALARLSEALLALPPGPAHAILYEQIALIAKDRQNKFDAALAYELVAYNRPEDTAARFSAAYAQSEAGLEHLACTNYSTLLKFDPGHANALNNRGVLLNKLGMPIRGVKSYQRSAENGNTLATANLAFKLLDAGFAKEAEELIDTALKERNPHENVARAMADLADRKEREEKTLQAVLKRGMQQQRFFHSYYLAHLTSKPIESLPIGEWATGPVAAQVTWDSTHLVAEWGVGPDKRRVEGDLKNRGGTVRLRKWEKQMFSDNWQFGTGSDAYAYFDEQFSQLTILSTEADGGLYVELMRKGS